MSARSGAGVGSLGGECVDGGSWRSPGNGAEAIRFERAKCPGRALLLSAALLAAAAFTVFGAAAAAAAESAVQDHSRAAATKKKHKVLITYEGQIGQGTAPGHARFVAKRGIIDSGRVVINGRDTGPIVYTTLKFTGKKGTFRISEKIIKGGAHTWKLTSGTRTYRGWRGKGVESGAPDSTGHIKVVMHGTVTH